MLKETCILILVLSIPLNSTSAKQQCNNVKNIDQKKKIIHSLQEGGCTLLFRHEDKTKSSESMRFATFRPRQYNKLKGIN